MSQCRENRPGFDSRQRLESSFLLQYRVQSSSGVGLVSFTETGTRNSIPGGKENRLLRKITIWVNSIVWFMKFDGNKPCLCLKVTYFTVAVSLKVFKKFIKLIYELNWILKHVYGYWNQISEKRTYTKPNARLRQTPTSASAQPCSQFLLPQLLPSEPNFNLFRIRTDMSDENWPLYWK